MATHSHGILSQGRGPIVNPPQSVARHLPIGAEIQPAGGVHFRIWAPKAGNVELTCDDNTHHLDPESHGYFGQLVETAGAGSLYGFRIDGSKRVYPDPASRFQPGGPHGLSRVVNPQFAWTDMAWPGVALKGQVLYEMHVGTFTPAGTYAAAAEKLPLLADVGVSVVEMMPVADFPGRFGWGYDGVQLFAPTRLYGEPDDLRRFVDRAHALGLGVILDVVYNHFGPDGNYLSCFSDTYTTAAYPKEWGDAINFDGPGSAPVREFFCANATYWIREFHFDGLRLDATQQIFDRSAEHIIAALTREARARALPRRIVVVGENEPQDVTLLRPREQGGSDLDALWNDDFQHSARIALTGDAQAYYSDYRGDARELLGCMRHGFLYQGQRSAWQGKPRGSPVLGLDRAKLITFIENHDQVANSAFGRRLVSLTDRKRLRAMTALLLLGPCTPMLFQGQEFASSTPFLYFCDHNRELAKAVAAGRREFLLQFPSTAGVVLPDPGDEATFRTCVLDWDERAPNAWALDLHRDLIALRRNDPVLRAQGATGTDGATLTDQAWFLRFFAADGADRLLVVNLGADYAPRIVPEPLLAPPEQRAWSLAWSSEDPRYGGEGVRSPLIETGWNVPGQSAILLVAQPAEHESQRP